MGSLVLDLPALPGRGRVEFHDASGYNLVMSNVGRPKEYDYDEIANFIRVHGPVRVNGDPSVGTPPRQPLTQHVRRIMVQDYGMVTMVVHNKDGHLATLIADMDALEPYR